jgi:hypothetical protein
MDKSYANNNEKLRNLIMKLPKELFFKPVNDRQKVLIYLNYLRQNYFAEVSKFTVDELIRGLIIKQLRVVNMKIIDINCLLIIGLNKINENTLSMSQKEIVRKLSIENNDKNDIDVVNRIIAQIRTKLPIDLSERMNFEHVNVLKDIIIKNYKGNIEKFQDNNNTFEYERTIDLNSIDTPMELTMFHEELNKFRKSGGVGVYNNNNTYGVDQNGEDMSKYYNNINNILNKDTDTFAVVDENGEMFFLEIKKGDYDEQEKMHINNLRKMKEEQERIETTSLNHINIDDMEKDIKAEYVDRQPIVMMNPKTQKLYYYDEYSRTLKLLPEYSSMKPISIDEAEKLLKSYEVSEEEIKKTLSYLESDEISPPDEDSYILDAENEKRLEEEESHSMLKTIIIILIIFILTGILIKFIFEYKKNIAMF